MTKRTQKDMQRLLDSDLQHVLGTPQGRRFFWRICEQAGLESPSFAGDATATAFNEGRRSIAINLVREAQRAAPSLYTRGLRERLDEVDRELGEQQEAPSAGE